MILSNSSHHKNRILFVDDEVLNIQNITAYLEDTDYELITAKDGYQAWSILENAPESIDILLLDRMTQGLNGLQVLSKMKEHPVLKHIPVILQTDLDETLDVLEGIQAGAFYYLTKPYEKDLLLSIIKTALDEHGAYVSLRNELEKSVCTLSLMKSGIFHFRTLEEMQDLALFISKACPKPEQALSGLSEIMINAIEHGNLGIGYDEKSDLITSERWQQEVEHRLSLAENSNKFVSLDFQNNNDHVNITITDMGEGFNWQDYLEISIERLGDNHGRGIAMAKVLSFDAIEYSGNGNKVTVTINRKFYSAKSNSNNAEVQNQLETA